MNCWRARIDCNALMDLHDIYEPDARCHLSYTPVDGCGIILGDPSHDNGDISKSLFFYLFIFKWLKSLPHWILLPWEMNNMLYIFKNRLLCSALVGKAIFNDVCFLIYMNLHNLPFSSETTDFGQIESVCWQAIYYSQAKNGTYSLFIMIVIFYTLGQWYFPVLSPRNYIYRYVQIVFIMTLCWIT